MNADDLHEKHTREHCGYTMTIIELREYHTKHHVGFIYQCKYCALLWSKLILEENIDARVES